MYNIYYVYIYIHRERESMCFSENGMSQRATCGVHTVPWHVTSRTFRHFSDLATPTSAEYGIPKGPCEGNGSSII